MRPFSSGTYLSFLFPGSLDLTLEGVLCDRDAGQDVEDKVTVPSSGVSISPQLIFSSVILLHLSQMSRPHSSEIISRVLTINAVRAIRNHAAPVVADGFDQICAHLRMLCVCIAASAHRATSYRIVAPFAIMV